MGELANKIRDKYPGSYDALSDSELETKVVARYPGVYDHLLEDKPSYNVDLTSKKALAKNQREMLSRNPDFQALPKREQQRMLNQSTVNSAWDYAAEPLRFASEAATMTANAGLRGLKGVASLVQGGGEAIRQGDIDAGLRKFNDKQAEFQPMQSPMEPSATGKMISDYAQEGIGKLSDLTGRPDIVEPVAQAAMDIGALMGLRGATKGVTVADVGRGIKKGAGTLADVTGAVVGTALNALPESVVTPKSLARSALKPYIGDVVAKQKMTDAGIETFLHDKNAVAIPEKFLSKNVAEMEEIVGRQNVMLDNKGHIRANIAPIEQYLNDFINESRLTPGTADASVMAAEKVLNDIYSHPDYKVVDGVGTIGTATAQTMKKNIWRYLREKGAFSRDGNPTLNDAMWSAADGLAKMVNEVIPEMAAENARYGEIANLNKMLTRSVNRIANNNVVSLHTAMQLIRGDLKGFGMAVMMKTIDHPTFKSYLAQQMAKAKGRPVKMSEVNNAVAAIKASPTFNPEVLPGRQSSQMDAIPGSEALGLEQGGFAYPPTVQRPQTVMNPEALPPQGAGVGDQLRMGSNMSMESGAMPKRGPYVANPERVPGRQSSEMDIIPSNRLSSLKDKLKDERGLVGKDINKSSLREEAIKQRDDALAEYTAMLDKTRPRQENANFSDKPPTEKMIIPSLTIDQVPLSLRHSGFTPSEVLAITNHLKQVAAYANKLLIKAGAKPDTNPIFGKQEIQEAIDTVIRRSSRTLID